MTDLQKTLLTFRSLIPHTEKLNPTVSHWSVGMHIHHCCLAMKGVCHSLIDSVPPKPPTTFLPVKFVVFLTGRIPRGKGQAPKAALPREKIAQTDLFSSLDEVEMLLSDAMKLEAERWFRHHVFGILSRDEALKFFVIHNNHHLRIIRDIV